MNPASVNTGKWDANDVVGATQQIVLGPCRLKAVWVCSMAANGVTSDVIIFDGTSTSDPVKLHFVIGGFSQLRPNYIPIVGNGIRFDTGIFAESSDAIQATANFRRLTFYYDGLQSQVFL